MASISGGGAMLLHRPNGPNYSGSGGRLARWRSWCTRNLTPSTLMTSIRSWQSGFAASDLSGGFRLSITLYEFWISSSRAHRLRVVGQQGEAVPFHATALAKVLLAQLPDEQIA